MNTSEKTDAIFPALFQAISGMGQLKKDAKNPFFKSSYATLGAVQEASIPVFGEHGIMVLQFPEGSDRGVKLTTRLVHAESDQWIESTLDIPLDKHDPQAVGSGISYARRYALQAIAGLAAEDDDGESAMKRGTPQKQAQKPQAKKEDTPIEDSQREIINELFKELEMTESQQGDALHWAGGTNVLENLTKPDAEKLIGALNKKKEKKA